MDTVGEGEFEMNSESSMEIHITICKIYSPWEFAIGCRELNPVLCDNLKGRDGRLKGGPRGRRHMYTWLIHVDIWQKPTEYCKAIILQLKMIINKNNFKHTLPKREDKGLPHTYQPN